MNRHSLIRRFIAVAILAVAVAPAQPAAAGPSRSCLRGGATLEAASGSVRVVRVAVKPENRHETRREKLLACWAKTGERIRVAEEVDHGADGFARTDVEIIQGRYVGVRRSSYGSQSTSVSAAVYDVRKDRRLHAGEPCDRVQHGEFYGVQDVAFLLDGGMAIACQQLVLYRDATSAPETLETAGVRQIAIAREFAGSPAQRLFWTVATAAGETTKSIAL